MPGATHPRRPRGSQSGRVKRHDKSFLFVTPFLPARLTALGSLRMGATRHCQSSALHSLGVCCFPKAQTAAQHGMEGVGEGMLHSPFEGSGRLLDPKFKTFSRLVSKTIVSFSRLKINK